MVQGRYKLSWDDLAAALAVAEAGSVRGAAERLGVAHTTLARRIEAAERALGVVLFVRGVGGYVLTDAGRLVAARAARMAEEADLLRRHVTGADRSPRGRVRATMPPPILDHVIAAALPRFVAEFPAIELDIDTGYGFRDLDRQDADVAVRLQNEPAQDLVGVRVATSYEALYVASEHPYPNERARDDAPLIAWTRSDLVLERARELGIVEPEIGFVCPDVSGQRALAEEGLGVAILPCIVGESSSRLSRVDPDRSRPAQDIWVLTHPDLRRSERVKTVSDFLVAALRAAKARFEGR